MTYSLTLMGTHHCKPNTCYERIPSISGLLEEVLDGVVVFHDVEQVVAEIMTWKDVEDLGKFEIEKIRRKAQYERVAR